MFSYLLSINYYKNLLVCLANQMKKKKQKEALKAISFLLSYLFRHKIRIFLGIIFLLCVDLCQLIIPKIIQNVLDALKNEKFTEEIILRNSLLIIAFGAVMILLRFLWRFFVIGASRKIEYRIRKDMFVHLNTLSFSYFNNTKTGDLVALLINDLRIIRMTVGPALIGFTDTLFLGIMTIIFMVKINPFLTLVTIGPLFMIIVFVLSIGTKLRERFRKVQEAFADISSQVQEVFSGIRVVKGFAEEENEAKLFEEKCENYLERNIHLLKLWGMLFPLIGLAASLSSLLFLAAGGIFTVLGKISMGEFVSFNFYIANLIWPIIAVGWVFNMVQQGIASTIRVMELLHTKPEIKNRKNLKNISEINGSVEFRDISFKYEKSMHNALSNINITVDKGSSLGIIGKPGSGKTTFISLLFRLFETDKGKILIDGTDIKDIDLFTLRSSIGYVPQDSFLFSDTVANNITLGLKEKTDNEQIIRFSKIAGIEKDIKKFKNQYDTVIGERGITLSGGQRQRLAIARALITEPPILILDDALSSVDTVTEKIILKNLEEEINKRTTIIIAHRISTIKDCDNIIVMDNGAVAENGTHDELLKLDGYYRKLYEIQKLKDEL